MRIKKRPSLSKPIQPLPKLLQQASITTTSFFPTSSSSTLTLDPLPAPGLRLARGTCTNFHRKKESVKSKEITVDTMGNSQMMQSFYQQVQSSWVKPSQFLNDIDQVSLVGLNGDSQAVVHASQYQVKLNQKMDKNMAKMDSLVLLMEKWRNGLTKILQYLNSPKSQSSSLMGQIRFWRALSKKFDELEYQFNNQNLTQIQGLMINCLKTRPQHRKTYDQFLKLKEEVISKTPAVRKLYLSLQEQLTGNVLKLNESSSIVSSTEYLIRILLSFQILSQSNNLLENRVLLVYDKMNEEMIQKLIVAPLYPRELANISSVKDKYGVIDKALSFYSNLINAMQEALGQGFEADMLTRCEHTRNVLVNLLQIMSYFQFLYKNKQVSQFSQLFCVNFNYNIFDFAFHQQWQQYMEKVQDSMQRKKYDP